MLTTSKYVFFLNVFNLLLYMVIIILMTNTNFAIINFGNFNVKEIEKYLKYY